jgi:hypothetical protein
MELEMSQSILLWKTGMPVDDTVVVETEAYPPSLDCLLQYSSS